MKNIFITQYGKETIDALIYTDKTVQQIEDLLKENGSTYNEIYTIPQENLQYYCIDLRVIDDGMVGYNDLNDFLARS